MLTVLSFIGCQKVTIVGIPLPFACGSDLVGVLHKGRWRIRKDLRLIPIGGKQGQAYRDNKKQRHGDQLYKSNFGKVTFLDVLLFPSCFL